MSVPRGDIGLWSTQQFEWQSFQLRPNGTGSWSRLFCFHTMLLLAVNHSCTVSAPPSCVLLLKAMGAQVLSSSASLYRFSG